jgi:REP element-mobilizing transposase RayT
MAALKSKKFLQARCLLYSGIMPRPPRILQDDFPYHVATRTAGRIFVFKNWTYKIIIGVLVEAQKRYAVKIHHFKMMHTHYHLVLSTTDSNLSDFQWYVNNQIAKRLNRRMGRKGHLWGDRFGATIVQTDRHLAACTRYVYNNGVRVHHCARASEDDQFCTFEFYSRGKPVPFIVTEDCFYLMDGNTEAERRERFIQFVDEPVIDEEIKAIRSGLKKLFYGSADFIEHMTRLYLE